ncbi:MAG TPA: hypothetical protein VKY31_11890 [Terriglobia bacterium]|nr:hypothetical protein [Terriglobia bacterium]
MRTIVAVLLVLQPVLFASPPQANDRAAYAQIASEKNPQTKKKLALNFEKNYPKSKSLPDVYMELSRILVSESDFNAARQYADKAVSTVDKMKTQPTPPEYTDTTWHQWLNTESASATKNLAWVNQMVTWQQEQLRSTLRGKR